MKTTFKKISTYFKNPTIVLLVLAPIVILLFTFSFLGVKSFIFSAKQIEYLQERITQLEETVKQLTGGVPPEGLHPVSGVILSQEDLGENSMLLRMNVVDIDIKAKTLDLALLFPSTDKALLEIVVTPETKISLLMPPQEGESEETKELVTLNYEQFKMGLRSPYAVLVQTISKDPAQQKRIQAFSITIFFGLSMPEPSPE